MCGAAPSARPLAHSSLLPSPLPLSIILPCLSSPPLPVPRSLPPCLPPSLPSSLIYPLPLSLSPSPPCPLPQVGSQVNCVLVHPSLVRSLLVANSSAIAKPDFGAGRLLGQGLVTSNGHLWAKQRRLINPAFKPERVQVGGLGWGGVPRGWLGAWVAGWLGGWVAGWASERGCGA